jgi:phenylalanyl-tRNA synthetase beta chain
MLVPLSWLKKYVEIKYPLKELMWKMTEVGMTTESSEKVGDDIVLDVEVTPNRPDWMSILGVAREIAAIQDSEAGLPQIPTLNPPQAKLEFKINNDFYLCPRYTAITIEGVRQKPSPAWMQEALVRTGLRPINNLVDITNYVMFELGNPIHVFDYDKLNKGEMTIMKSKGGEEFISVDGKSYILPEDAVIFKSGKKVVDLCGIKGGCQFRHYAGNCKHPDSGGNL